jgi:nitroreductase
MQLADVIRTRRMVRRYAPDPVPDDLLERILWAGRRAPSAGFSQGLDLLVLRSREQLEPFWRMTAPVQVPEYRDNQVSEGPTVVILPLPDSRAYLDRYSLPDKAGSDMQAAERWPVPYWDLDAAMSAMLILLAAVDEGLGAIFTGIVANERKMLDSLGVPADRRPIGMIGLGYIHPEGPGNPGSVAVIPKRNPSDVVHWGAW